jgi:hypothetical protein
VIEIVRLRKILETKPQQFMLVLRDKMNRTEFGAEGGVRTILKAVGGIPARDRQAIRKSEIWKQSHRVARTKEGPRATYFARTRHTPIALRSRSIFRAPAPPFNSPD